jgi:BirA family transcriptional regulator, biotin operon repressor / biotin---[acetyl-CoA-carboxylase] ligase
MTVFDATLQALGPVLGPGVALRAVAETGSTNSDLLDACRAQVAPQLLVAERQSAGRGRLGRVWHAEPGDSLTFSLAWPMAGAPLDGLSLAVGSGLAQALDPAGHALQLKWPNDLWFERRKLGGVLIETLSQGGAPQAVVVGVGLNLRAPLLHVPTAGLQQLDPRWTAPLALAAVLPPLVDLLRSWKGFGASAQAAYAARDGLRGLSLRAEGLGGVAEGVDAEGLLLLRDAQGLRHRLRAGEVKLEALA